MNLNTALKKAADKKTAIQTQKFFKTGKGEYGEGDIFIGITVPECRELAKKYEHLSLLQIKKHLQSKIHEERQVALMILSAQYKKANKKQKEKIFKYYLKNKEHINNWDLVDGSAWEIVGAHLLDKDKDILHVLATSRRLWDRRIAIVSTMHFIRNNHFDTTLQLAEEFMNDKEDLMHKATGWLLREVGKKDQKRLEIFLDRHHKTMPRTMLRYAIERLAPEKKKHYMRR